MTPYIMREKERGVRIRIVLGVDQKGTSRDALEEVLSWKVDAWVYHTRAFNIFHPKVYLFEDDDIFTLIVGSNNLTEMGLVKNVESSLLVKDIRSNPVHKGFYEYWKGILDGSEGSLYPITKQMIAAHKLHRRYIEIEIGDQMGNLVAHRMAAVINGEQGGISSKIGWHGGGNFSFYDFKNEEARSGLKCKLTKEECAFLESIV